MKWPESLWQPKLFLLLVAVAYLVMFAIPVSQQGIENLRMVEAFNPDEANLLRYIRQAIDERKFGVIMHNYGYLYFYLGVAPLMLVDYFLPVTDPQIVIVFRLLSSLFFLGSVLMTYLLGAFVFNKRIALVSSLFLLLGSSILYDASVTIHSYTAELFFMLSGFYFMYRFYFKSNPRDIIIAAVMSGFAFSCNYSGILLIPFIVGVFLINKRTYSDLTVKNWWAVFGYIVFILIFINPFYLNDYFLPNTIGYIIKILIYMLFIVTVLYALYRVSYILISQEIWGNKIIRRMDFLYMIGFVFWTAFVFSSPGAIYNLNFIDSFQKVIGLANISEMNIGAPKPLLWLRNLVRPEFMGGPILPIFSILSIGVVYAFKKGLVKSFFPLWIWIAFFFSVIVILINPTFPFYMIPILPIMILLAVFTGEFLVAKSSLKWKSALGFTLVFVLLFSLVFVGQRKKQLDDYLNKKYDPRLVVGDWLSSNYRTDTKIISDQGVYLPSKLLEAKYTWGLTDLELDSADVVVINKNAYSRYINEDLEIVEGLEREEWNIANNYIFLIAGSGNKFRKHYTWADITVFIKNN